MSAPPLELRPTIDRIWLERVAQEEPVVHAYALWDLDQHPDRARFVSANRADSPRGYLLLWPFGEGGTLVHWVGDPRETEALVDRLPPRPLVVVCDEAGAPVVERLRGPARLWSLLVKLAPVGVPPPAGPADEFVRPLSADDRTMLQRFANQERARIGSAYIGLDPGAEPIWGGFERGRLVALARPAVRLPHLWVIGGVYVDPEHRNQGWGRAVVRAVMGAAARAGAPSGLFVREDSAPARAVYASLGFRSVGRRCWVDAGLGREP
jgi:GNAT superfamily N-acetyltransferase